MVIVTADVVTFKAVDAVVVHKDAKHKRYIRT